MTPKFVRNVDGILCMTVAEHEAILAAAIREEREECAQVCDELSDASNVNYAGVAAKQCAEQIRNRGAAS
jgi:hypothetical protein